MLTQYCQILYPKGFLDLVRIHGIYWNESMNKGNCPQNGKHLNLGFHSGGTSGLVCLLLTHWKLLFHAVIRTRINVHLQYVTI
jgi:hypothetical protein